MHRIPILSEQLPEVLDSNLAESADVFCEPGWFNTNNPRIFCEHRGRVDWICECVDEFADGGGGELAAELRVRTADHAHRTSSDTRQKMNEAGVMTGFLPITPYCNGDAWLISIMQLNVASNSL